VPGPRATWHRRVGVLPIGYLAAVAVLSLVHRAVADSWWLLVHLLLLGAVTNAIVIWGDHFARALLRAGGRPGHKALAVRLAVLNVGVVGVLVGGSAGPAWLGVAGATGVFVAIGAHLAALARDLHRALPARFTVTVHYYLAASLCLLLGIPAGAWMLVDRGGSRILLFHLHVNLLGWVTLTILGTLLTFWPTVLRTRLPDGAHRASTRGLPLCLAGVAALGLGTLAWWPVIAAAGVGALAVAVLLLLGPAAVAARQRPPSSFAAWSIAAGIGWLLVALGWDAVTLLTAPDPATAVDRFGRVLIVLGVGFVSQVLIGSLSYLMPMTLGGGPEQARLRGAVLDVNATQRVTMANLALAVILLPVPSYVRITMSLLLLAALVQFLAGAVRVLLFPTRSS
jgi:nitrite reductase (NO-forming)